MRRCARPTLAFSCALVSAGSRPQSRWKLPVFVTQIPANRAPFPVRVNASMWISRPFAFFTTASRSAPVAPGLQFQFVLSVPLLAIQTAVNGTSAAPSGRWTEISLLSVLESSVLRADFKIAADQSHLDGVPSQSPTRGTNGRRGRQACEVNESGNAREPL